MDWKLMVENDLMSAIPRIVFKNEDGQEVFDCTRTMGLIGPGWEIECQGERVMSMSRRVGMKTRWAVAGENGEFELQQRLLAMDDVYDVKTGAFEGASFRASIVGRSFSLEWRDVVLSKGSGPLFSFHDLHEVELMNGGREVELLTVACIVALHDEHMRKNGDE